MKNIAKPAKILIEIDDNKNFKTHVSGDTEDLSFMLYHVAGKDPVFKELLLKASQKIAREELEEFLEKLELITAEGKAQA